MLCSKCGRRESSIRVGGRDLCVLCANNEVTKRAYRVLSEAGALHTEAIYTFSSPLFQGWNNLIGRLLARMGKKNEPKLYELPFESHGSVDEMLHLMLTYRKEGLILLPITTDFLTAYLIYSISKGHGPFYSNIYSPHFTLGLAKFVSPMIRTSALELAGVGEIRFNIGDDEFDTIYMWVLSELNDNSELLFTAPTSITLFSVKERCLNCGSSLVNGRCKFCEI